jgi:SWIM zinc finger
MSSIAATPSVVNEIVDSADEREFWTVVREHERPPYQFPEEGINNRLNLAARLVYEEHVHPQSDGSFQVDGSGGRRYRVEKSCSCPASQKSKSKWCKHLIAVALYIEWQRRLRPLAPTFSPVALGTLRAGTAPLPPTTTDDEPLGNGYPVDDETLPLPLPPVSVDERLAAGPHATEERREAYAMLQENTMTTDEYIPEPDTDRATTALVEPPVAEPARVTIPAEYVMQIKGNRHVLYAGLVIGAQRSGLVSLAADWTYNDAELSLAHAVATFADGRRYEDSGDASPSNVSKGIAGHFRRVALTRAKARCLRDALGISECSVEEMADETLKREVPDMAQPSEEKALRRRIWAKVQELAPDVKTREAVEAVVSMRTGLALMPDNYAQILAKLSEVAR